MRDRVTLLSGSDVWRTQALPKSDLPAVMLSDGPHGLRKQNVGGDHLGATGSNPATCFPTASALASSWDESLLHEIGEALGREARAEGVAVILGPGLNIKRHPNCGRNFEYMSEDPLLSGRMAAAMVDGIQSQGVGACLKHFAVNNQESHRLVVDAVVDERTLREIYLTGFEIAVRSSRPWTIMAAYNSVNGTFCCDNRRLLTEILREEWGFDGLVMSDWGATNDRVAGVRAGMDLEMPGSGGISDGDVIGAVRRGELTQDELDGCVDRVLHLVDRAAHQVGDPAALDQHHELARRAAADSTVLLTNDGVLPLASPASIAVIGAFAKHPRYQGAGSSLVNPARLETAWEALQRRADPLTVLTYAPGYDPDDSESDTALVSEAVAAASEADVVLLMVGLPGAYEAEGFDRTDMSLPVQHEALVEAIAAANPRTIVTLSNGAPVTMPWIDRPAAVVESYLGGQACGAALIDVVFGDREPGGRLAETFPMRQSDVPSDPYFPGHPHQVEYREGVFVGYRYYATADVDVRFPFGHGLSYTTFAYTNVRLSRRTISAGDEVQVTVTVTNTGPRAGSEVVQIYVHDGTGAAIRPDSELKAFAKVHLEPGESETVTLQLDERAFAFYDVGSAAWRTGAGKFEIRIGSSSAATHATRSVTMTSDLSRRVTSQPLIADSDDQFEQLLGRPLPTPRPARPFTRLTTVGELSGSLLGRPVRRALHAGTAKQFADLSGNNPLIVEKLHGALDEMPLRGVVLFAGGLIPWPVLDTFLNTLNARASATTTVALMRSLPGVAARLIPHWKR